MTKDEAKSESSNVIKDYRLDREEVIDKVRDIIGKIDQSPAEFSVSELLSHLKEIGRMVELHSTGTWVIRGKYECDADVIGSGPEPLRAKLLELAKPPEPPEPETVMMAVPTGWAKAWSKWTIATGDELIAHNNAKAALEKAGVKR